MSFSSSPLSVPECSKSLVWEDAQLKTLGRSSPLHAVLQQCAVCDG